MTRRHEQTPRAAGKPETGRDAAVPQKTDLSLESTGSQAMRGLSVQNGSSSGHNPYDTMPNTSSSTGMQRLADMRRLSEWIRMKRELERELEHESDKDK
jgi:hypothetical protein